MAATDIVLLPGTRTAFGDFGGKLVKHSATDLAVIAGKAALEKGRVAPADVDQVVFGNVQQTSADALYLARHVGLRCGAPDTVPGLTVNRLCGSGFQAIITAAEQIQLGYADCVLAGGTESMSQAPFVARDVRFGIRFGQERKLEDSLWAALTDSYTGMKMAETAEKLGEQYGVTREDADAYAFTSQERYKAALEAGWFADEIVPITLKSRRGETVFDRDEHPRLDANLASMQKLRAVFKKNGLVTAGNASGICDGASAVVVARADWAEARGLEPIARLAGWGITGCDPTIMGLGPASAARQALERTGLTLDQMDLVEVNEAFSAQYVAVERELGLDRARTNVNGGAISIGHPLGASGARITVHLTYELMRRQARYALGSACIGGGQGIAVILERL